MKATEAFRREARAILPIVAVSLLLHGVPALADGEGLPVGANPTLRDIREAVCTVFYERFTEEIGTALPLLPICGSYREAAENVSRFRNAAETCRYVAQNVLTELEAQVAERMEASAYRFGGFGEPENLPTWQTVAALNMTFADAFVPDLARNCSASWRIGADGTLLCALSFAPAEEMCADSDEPERMTLRLNGLYLNTVYDENGAEREKLRYVFEEAYLAGLSNPLPGDLIKNCWYDPRDNRTRYHMGADIRSDGGKRIHSMTDGTVKHVGFLPVPGNYVVIEDPFGYEYHYYHMRELTRFVRPGDTVHAGDVIGRVGNTGNSSANHLHLSVAAPNGRYLNPFDLLVAAGFEPVRPSDLENRADSGEIYLKN